ncbi:MAG: hypothetical protein H6551_13480 [Chitinophagales bacterium]|nr:hypothetical protein [Chitinophagaceae bacterium]MCB9066145.1 hypothetical protein [Chitinophagales bacterium]
MRILLLILFSATCFAQDDPRMAYSLYSRLGINGPVKTIITKKYTRLKYNAEDKKSTKGIIYSVIKNWYDTMGRLTQDSLVMYYNRDQGAIGYCKTYTYDSVKGQPVINVTTKFNCIPPYDNDAEIQSVIEFTTVNDSVMTAQEFTDNDSYGTGLQPVASYRFYLTDTLLRRTTYNIYRKDRQTGSSSYEYDQYGNFTKTIEKNSTLPAVDIRHDVLVIDANGNATQMLNYQDAETKPEFMTLYEIEYYE